MRQILRQELTIVGVKRGHVSDNLEIRNAAIWANRIYTINKKMKYTIAEELYRLKPNRI